MTDPQPVIEAVVQIDDGSPAEPGEPGEPVMWYDHSTPEQWDQQHEWASAVAQTPAQVARDWEKFRRHAIEEGFDKEALLHGVEKVYSTSQAAAFFGRSNQWMYWGLGKGIFTYKDGTPITPERVGKMGKRRFTLPLIREIALSCFRRGSIKEPELKAIMAKILLAEFGEKSFAKPGKRR